MNDETDNAAVAVSGFVQLGAIVDHRTEFLDGFDDKELADFKSMAPQIITGGIAALAAKRKTLGFRSRPAMQDQLGRNDPCPCGSGGKYKKCCYRATQ